MCGVGSGRYFLVFYALLLADFELFYAVLDRLKVGLVFVNLFLLKLQPVYLRLQKIWLPVLIKLTVSFEDLIHLVQTGSRDTIAF